MTFEPAFVSPWLARKDADWRLDELYDFVAPLGATLVRHGFRARSSTSIAIQAGPRFIPGRRRRTCPHHDLRWRTPLSARKPDAAEIADRRRLYFDPYHAALAGEIARLRRTHKRVALFDAHSIRSIVPRLFEGELPMFNLGTNSERAATPDFAEAVGAAATRRRTKAASSTGGSRAVGSRAPYGRPVEGVEALQLDLPAAPTCGARAPVAENWPAPIDEARGDDARHAQTRSGSDPSEVSWITKTTKCCHSRR